MKMKAGLLLLVVLLVLVSACGKTPSDEECRDTWIGMDWEEIFRTSIEGITSLDDMYDNVRDMMTQFVQMVLNEEHSPDSVGFMLKACIERGWDWRGTLEEQMAVFEELAE